MRPRDDHEVQHVGGVAQLPRGQRGPAPFQNELFDCLTAHEGLVKGQQLVKKHPEAEAVHFLRIFLSENIFLVNTNPFSAR